MFDLLNTNLFSAENTLNAIATFKSILNHYTLDPTTINGIWITPTIAVAVFVIALVFTPLDSTFEQQPSWLPNVTKLLRNVSVVSTLAFIVLLETTQPNSNSLASALVTVYFCFLTYAAGFSLNFTFQWPVAGYIRGAQ